MYQKKKKKSVIILNLKNRSKLYADSINHCISITFENLNFTQILKFMVRKEIQIFFYILFDFCSN